jgi:hypothetical protein
MAWSRLGAATRKMHDADRANKTNKTILLKDEKYLTGFEGLGPLP